MVVGSPEGRQLGRLEYTADQLSSVRHAVRGMVLGLDAGLDKTRAEDVVLAVHEVAVNSVLYGAGSARLSVWEDGQQLTFEIENRRNSASAPVLRTPTADQVSGRGLWLARHLVDDLAVEVTPDNVTVRLHLARARSSPAG